MSDTPYSNREIDARFSNLGATIAEGFKDVGTVLTRIETQTNKTNGRVTALEKGQWLAMGSIAVLTPVVLGLSTWVLLQVVTLKQDLRNEARSAVDEIINPLYTPLPTAP